jgi:hypothetical protein
MTGPQGEAAALVVGGPLHDHRHINHASNAPSGEPEVLVCGRTGWLVHILHDVMIIRLGGGAARKCWNHPRSGTCWRAEGTLSGRGGLSAQRETGRSVRLDAALWSGAKMVPDRFSQRVQAGPGEPPGESLVDVGEPGVGEMVAQVI